MIFQSPLKMDAKSKSHQKDVSIINNDIIITNDKYLNKYLYYWYTKTIIMSDEPILDWLCMDSSVIHSHQQKNKFEFF